MAVNAADIGKGIGELLVGVGALAAWRHARSASKQMQPNHGDSLRDAVDELHDQLVSHAERDVQVQVVLTDQVGRLEQYSHKRWHDFDNKIYAIEGLSKLLRARLEDEPPTP